MSPLLSKKEVKRWRPLIPAADRATKQQLPSTWMTLEERVKIRPPRGREIRSMSEHGRDLALNTDAFCSVKPHHHQMSANSATSPSTQEPANHPGLARVAQWARVLGDS